VSYALRLAVDAARALAELPLGAQEEVFDVLDRIADEADPLAPEVEVQHVVYRTDREAVYVRLYCSVMHDTRTVALERLVAVIR
jgi:hypothetical protein